MGRNCWVFPVVPTHFLLLWQPIYPQGYPQAKDAAKNLTKDGIQIGSKKEICRSRAGRGHDVLFGLLPVSAASGIGAFPEQLEYLF